MPILSPTETLERHIDQNGVLPGPQKLAQFQQALRLRDTPPLYSQDGRGDEAIVYVKIFDPSGTGNRCVLQTHHAARDPSSRLWRGRDAASGARLGTAAFD